MSETRRVRRLRPEDMRAWTAQMLAGFHHHGPEEALAGYMSEQYDLERAWAAYDGERVVGTLRSFATPLTVPGPSEVAAAALTNVTVAPTHRRRGLLTEMITADLQASKDKGEPLGILIASEWPIYGRFGYGPAIEAARYQVDTAALGWLHPSEGSLEVADAATMRRQAPTVYEGFRRSQPGAIGRSEHWWDRQLRQVEVPGDDPSKDRYALYRSAGHDVEGYVRYEAKADWEGMRPRGKLELKELVSLTPEADRALWGYCASVDLLVEMTAHDRPVDDPLPLLVADGRHVKQAARYDFVWVRLLDAAAALTARGYEGEGRLVIEVVDDLGLTGGRYLLEAGPSGSTCTATTESADVTMPVASLGAVFMGGEAFARLHAAGWLEEEIPGAVPRADRIFRTARAPWCNTWF